jgi:hypothetical protein
MKRELIHQIAKWLQRITADRENYWPWEVDEIDDIVMRLKQIADAPWPVTGKIHHLKLVK